MKYIYSLTYFGLELLQSCVVLLDHVLCPKSTEQMFKGCFLMHVHFFLSQKVFLLPKTVLAMVDCEAFNGQAYCYRENKGWY